MKSVLGLTLFLPVVCLFFLQSSVTSCTKEVVIKDTLIKIDTLIKKDTVVIKDTIFTKTSPIEGLWIGTYTADLLPNDPPRYYSFIIKPNNVLAAESHPLGNTSYFGTGTWILNGNILTCTIIYPNSPQGVSVSQSTTAVYDKTLGKLTTGVWINNTFPGGTGKFTMSRVN